MQAQYISLRKQKSFTLAELLITLTIIGVIASYTVPAIQNKMEENSFRSACIDAVSILSRATTLIALENGSINTATGETIRADYKTKLIYLKEDTTENIFAPYYYYYKSSTGYSHAGATWPAVALSNGYTIYWWNRSSTCSDSLGGLTGICTEVYVDINGKKSPNVVGKDMFSFWLVKQNGEYRILPKGIKGDGYGCGAGCNSEWGCDGCAALILRGAPLP